MQPEYSAALWIVVAIICTASDICEMWDGMDDSLGSEKKLTLGGERIIGV